MTVPGVVGYYVHHQGSGHLHRALALRQALVAAGTDVALLSSLPRPEAYDGDWLDLPRDDATDGPPGPADPTARGRLHWAPIGSAGLTSRMAAMSAWIERARPSLLVSDVSQEVALLARLHGVPVVSVVLPGDRSDPTHALGLGVSAAVVGFWPESARGMVRGLPDDVDLRAVGAQSRYAPVQRTPGGPGRRVVVLQGSGGDGFDPCALGAARAQTPDWEWTVLGPDSWLADPWPVLCAADVVVAHAGQNAVAEIAAARVPAVLVPHERPHDEQRTTARVLAAGAWPALVEPRLPSDGWLARLEAAAALDGGAWSTWCDGRAAERFVDVVGSIVGSGGFEAQARGALAPQPPESVVEQRALASVVETSPPPVVEQRALASVVETSPPPVVEQRALASVVETSPPPVVEQRALASVVETSPPPVVEQRALASVVETSPPPVVEQRALASVVETSPPPVVEQRALASVVETSPAEAPA